MKKIIFIALLITAYLSQAQSVIGAWEAVMTEENGDQTRMVVIFTEKHQVATWYDLETGKFQWTNGGLYSLEGNTMTETVEFHTLEPEEVGKSVSFEVKFDGNDKLGIVGQELWLTRIDDGSPGALAGAWLISGRMRDGELRERATDRPRKTMKILSGTRFQWIAYNTETKQFMGTGGGTYTTEDGKYTENIEFFSRDDNRVGASLKFSYELKDGKWHHSGNNSRGEPMYEVWSVREK